MSVLLVTLDTTRADRLGCYGFANAATPNLDALAAEGVLFEQAYTVAPITLPSHVSILTGALPLRHGVRDNRGFEVPESMATLAEALRSAGYRTGAFLAAFPLSAKFGLDQGFEVYDDRFDTAAEHRFEFPERRAEEVVAEAEAWLTALDTRDPFFGWVHLFDPHEAYRPPEPFASRFAEDPYQGEIAYLDRALGRLLEVLESRGRADDTLVIVVADHGEGLGEHEERNHVTLVYNSTVRVPMLMRGPELPHGRRIPQTVRTIDLVPTVTDLLGLPGLPDAVGRSLAEVWQNTDAPSRPAYFESYWPQLQQGWSPLRGLVHGRWKIIEAPGAGTTELYDVLADPGELDDLAAREPDRLAEMQRRLAELRERSPETLSTARRVTPEDLQALQRLGYAGTTRNPVEAGRHPREMVAMLSELSSVMRHLDAGRPEAALATLDVLEQRYPGSIGLHEYRALCYADLGRREPRLLKQAIAELRLCLANSPAVPSLWRRLAEVQQLQGDRAAAVRSTEQILKLDPRDHAAAVVASELYLQLSDVASALEVFERVREPIELDGEFEIARATALAAAQQYEEAIPRYRRVVQWAEATPSQRFRATNRLGLIYREQGELAAAVTAFRRAVELEPTSPVARGNLASALERGDQRAEARQIYEQLSRENPDEPYYRERAQALR